MNKMATGALMILGAVITGVSIGIAKRVVKSKREETVKDFNVDKSFSDLNERIKSNLDKLAEENSLDGKVTDIFSDMMEKEINEAINNIKKI